ncbi:MAG: halogenase, partial [Mycobacterium sp.]
TSVGIVADPAFHGFDEFNTLDKARAWLGDHEPQCAAVVAEHADLIKDFRVMKHYSHGATQVFDGRDRWCLTGDSGIFLDPLYSSGLDLVAIGNGLITDMIVRELDHEDVVARSQISDSLFRSLTQMWLAVYQDQYTLMGTPTVMSAKVIWDVAFYWGFVGLLYTNGRFTSVADDPGFVPYLEGLIALSNRVQRFFREWAAVETGASSVPFVDLYAPLNFMVRLHTAMMGTSPNFSEQFDANARLLRQLAGQLAETVVSEKSSMFGADDVVRQVQAWQRDSLLQELRSTYRHEQAINPVSGDWIVSTSPILQSS